MCLGGLEEGLRGLMAAQIWHNGAETMVYQSEGKTSETMTVSTRKKIGNCLCVYVCKRVGGGSVAICLRSPESDD